MRSALLRLGGLLPLLIALFAPACTCARVPEGGVVLIREGDALHDNVRRLAATSDHVYYVQGEHGSGWRLRRVPKEGGAMSQLAEMQKGILALAPTEEAVHFAVEGAVWRAPAGGGPAARILESKDVCPTRLACGLAVSGEDLFVAARTAILRMPARGGPAAEIVRGAWAPADPPFALAADATHVYWTHHLEKEIYRAPRGGGPAELVAGGLPGSPDPTLVIAGGFLYYVSGASLFRVPVTGGAPALIAPTGSHANGLPGGFQVVGDTVYFARSAAHVGAGTRRAPAPGRKEGEGGVMKVPVTGGDPEWVARGVEQVYALDADSDAVYLATDGGQIVKHPP